MLDAAIHAKGRISDGAAVEISEVPLAALWQIAGWERFDKAADRLLAPLRLALGDDFRTTRRQAGVTLWRIAPDRALVAGDAPLEELARVQTGPDLVRLDLSEARVRLRLDGPGAGGLLARLIPVNTSLAAFPVDSFAQTGLHHVGVLVDRLSQDRFDLMVPRGWVRSVGEMLQLHLTGNNDGDG